MNKIQKILAGLCAVTATILCLWPPVLAADLRAEGVEDLSTLTLPPVAKKAWVFRRFPIMAWWPPPGTKTLRDFQRYKEAGFTIYPANPDAGFQNALKLARRVGIPVMPHRTLQGFDVPRSVKPIALPEEDFNVVGWLTRDEPGGYKAVSQAIGEVNVLIGFFRNKAGDRYALVVNKRHGKNQSSKDMADTMDLTFSADINEVEAVSWLDGTVGKLAMHGSKASLRIHGGTSVLIKAR